MSQIRLYGAVLDGAVLDPVAATVAPVVNAREWSSTPYLPPESSAGGRGWFRWRLAGVGVSGGLRVESSEPSRLVEQRGGPGHAIPNDRVGYAVSHGALRGRPSSPLPPPHPRAAP